MNRDFAWGTAYRRLSPGSNANHRSWRFSLAVVIFVFLAINSWLLIAGAGMPYVMDNNESFSVLWHAYNMFHFEWDKSWLVTDESFSPHPEAHPFVHTHQGNWPRVFGFFIFALGARTVQSQIVITTLSIGLLSVVMAFQCFYRISRNPPFAAFAVLMLMSSYVLFAQWQVVTYRVWHTFFVFATLLLADRLGSARPPRWAYIALFVNYLCLFYYELVFAAFVAAWGGFYVIFRLGRNWKQSVAVVATMIGGAVSSIGILLTQLTGFMGWENVKKDLFYTFVARNSTVAGSEFAEKVMAFYSDLNVAFWGNFIDSSGMIGFGYILKAFFMFDFQTHTPLWSVFGLIGFASWLFLLARNFLADSLTATWEWRLNYVIGPILVFAPFEAFLVQRAIVRSDRTSAILAVGFLLFTALILLALSILQRHGVRGLRDFKAKLQASDSRIASAARTALIPMSALFLTLALAILPDLLGSTLATGRLWFLNTAILLLFVSLFAILCLAAIEPLRIARVLDSVTSLLSHFWNAYSKLFFPATASVNQCSSVTFSNCVWASLSVLVFLFLYLMTVSLDTLSGFNPGGAPIRDQGTSWVVASVLASVLTVCGIGRVASGKWLWLNEPMAVNWWECCVFAGFAGLFIRYQSALYDHGYGLLWTELTKTWLPLWGVRLLLWGLLIFVLCCIANWRISVSSGYFRSVGLGRIDLYLVSGLIAYLLLYRFSAGYLHTGYFWRSVPFTFFFTQIVLAVGLWMPLRMLGVILKKRGRSSASATLAQGAIGVIALVVLFGWGAIQANLVRLMPPNLYSELPKLLGAAPFKGASFIVGNYAAPVAAWTGQWAFYDSKFHPEQVRLSANGYHDMREGRYLWLADRKRNNAYERPQYYICMFATNNIGVVIDELAKKLGHHKRSLGCQKNYIDGQSPDEEKIISPKIVARDDAGDRARGIATWQIISLDWDYAPFLWPVPGQSSANPVGLNVEKIDSLRRRLMISFDARQQNGKPVESNVALKLFKFDSNCPPGSAKGDVVESIVTRSGQVFLTVPMNIRGYIAVEVTPRTNTKVGHSGSSTTILLDGMSDPEPCEFDIKGNTLSDLTVARPRADEMQLRWKQILGTQFNVIEWARDNEEFKVLAAEVPNDFTHLYATYKIGDISPNANYRIRVRACDSAKQCSRPSPIVVSTPP